MYEKIAEQDGTTDLVCNIEQGGEFMSMTANMPALLKNTTMYSLVHKRPLMALTHLEVMGFSVNDISGDDPETSIKPMCITRVATTMVSNPALRRIAGNAFHVSSVGTVLLFLLCSAKRHERNACDGK
jgi:hypothetical protein